MSADHGHGADEPFHPSQSEGNVMLVAGSALLVGLLALGLSGPRVAHGHAEHGDGHGAAPTDLSGPAPAAQGRQAVATAAEEASQAALKIMQDGGNAFDALVTASLVTAVVRPHSTGIGGGGFLVFRKADGTLGALDGRETAPGAASRDMYLDENGKPTGASVNGPRAGGVPGLIKLLHETYQRHGSKNVSWAKLVAPAIDRAKYGFTVRAPLARAIAKKRQVLSEYAASAATFLPGGKPPRTGESSLLQRDLARTLEQLADDPESFYRGAIADQIAASEALITKEDLANYSIVERQAVIGRYRGLKVISMPPPSSGGPHLIQMLNILEGYDLAAMGHHSPMHLHVLIETMRRAFADRSEHMGDPVEGVEVPLQGLLSEDYADTLRASISLTAATPSSDIGPGRPADFGGDHTTHISIVDKEGNAVSSTQTINGSLGSGYVIPGTGILLNNEMDDFAAQPGQANQYGLVQGEKNAIAPGKRPLSSMTPTIVLKEGVEADELVLVLGSPGGPRIITSVLQALSNVVDFGMPLPEAVAAARIHHQWLPDRVYLEPEAAEPKVQQALIKLGHSFLDNQTEKGQGDVQAVIVLEGGELQAVSDPRRTGSPAAGN